MPLRRTPLKRTGRIKPKPTREKAKSDRPPLSDVPWWLAQDGRRSKMLTDRTCRVCGGPAVSFHHVPPRGWGGLNVADSGGPCCGDGVSGCHGALEAMDAGARRAYGENMAEQEVAYVLWLLGSAWGREFLAKRYLLIVPKLWPAWRGAGYYDRPRVRFDGDVVRRS